MANNVKYSKILQEENDENNSIHNEIPSETIASTDSLMKDHRRFKHCHSHCDVWEIRNLNSHLIEAIIENNFNQVQVLLQKGAQPNARCRTYKFTAVHLAVLVNSTEILLELIEKGAFINKEDKYGQTPLHYAAWYNYYECIEILLENLADSDQRNAFLNKRKQENNYEVIKEEILKDSLDHKCSTIKQKLPHDLETGVTALHLACQKLYLKSVGILLKYEQDFNLRDDRNLSAFEVIGENLRMVKNDVNENDLVQLVTLMPRPNSYNSSPPHYFTPVHAGVMLSSSTAIKLLITAGFNPNLLDHRGQTPIHLAIIKQLAEPLSTMLDCVSDVSELRNAQGLTPFQCVVERQWLGGVGLLLRTNVDLTEKAKDGRTVLHVAASCGNVELLEDLLELDEIETILNTQNNLGETPLFCAITSNNLDCVKALLEKDVDLAIKLDGNINILHRAAELGNEEILSALLTACEEKKVELIDELDTLACSGLTPLQMAALNNHIECVNELLYKKCDYFMKSTSVVHSGATAIHLAAERGNNIIVEIFLKENKDLLWVEDDKGRIPLHCAALQGHRKCIEVFLNNGADLSTLYVDESVLDIIYRTISRPTEFLNHIFNNCIGIDDKNTLITDQNCMININFDLLIPENDKFNQMSILLNILTNSRGLEQKKLLLHPLIESFLHIKWNKMSKIFWVLLILHMLFVLVLTAFVVSLFYFDDSNRPVILNIEIIRVKLIGFLLSVTIPEILLAAQRLKQYKITMERVIKWSCIVLTATMIWAHSSEHDAPWLRHVATLALLSSWIEMMFMLSKIPTWGYYVQMFLKVSKNVIKVMTVFSFLVIGFALAFMIEFQNIEPFEDPLRGFIKTIVMMTAELDYSDMFTGENRENAHVINLIIYVVFLLLGTIVLMNLMVGLAVSDIHDLEIIGKIDRHAQQIDFLSMLESNTLARFLPEKFRKKLIENKCIQDTMKIYPSHPKCKVMKILSPELKESIIDIAADNYKRESEITMEDLWEKLNDIMDAINILKQNNSSVKLKL